MRNGAIVRSHIDKSRNSKCDTDKHLRYLQKGHHHGPGWTNLDGHEEIIEIHDGMDAIIHIDKENAAWSMSDIGMPAIQQDSNVMVPMQENEFLLVNENKESVKEFTVVIKDAKWGL